MAKDLRGRFITFEGAEGSGKSTQAKLAARYIRRRGRKVLHIREPGGVPISEAIRKILLSLHSKHMVKECEMLLYMAARAQLVTEIIRPALQKGMIVLCDRFLDSTVAYQGYGYGVDMKIIRTIGRFATFGICPDLTLLFDIDAEQGLNRISRKKDRIESRTLAYHRRVRQGYLRLARQDPRRIKVIQANGAKTVIQDDVRFYIDRLLG